MAKATGDYLHFNDHDDRYIDGALGRFAQIAQQHPGRPIVGRMRVWAWNSRQPRLDPPDYLWKTKSLVARGQFGGHMLFVPNRPALLGRWEPESDYCADFQFVKSTLAAFRRARLKEVWVEDFIVECRPWARPA